MSHDNHWDRRTFLKLLAVGGAASTLPNLWGCGTTEEDKKIVEQILADTGPTLKSGFPTSLLDASEQEVDLSLDVISGALPTDLNGHVFVVAALPWNDGTMVFNGDGMMYRLDLGQSAKPTLKSRIAKSPCYYADVATRDESLPYTELAFVNAGVARLGKLGMRNELNTAFMPMNERLLVTYDGGRPWEVDVETLELITPIGKTSEWQSTISVIQGPFKAYTSTAHPFWDQYAGEMISVDYSQTLGELQSGFTKVMRWKIDGQMESWSMVDDQGEAIEIRQSVHQLAVTRDYVIIVDCAFLVENEQIIDPSVSRAQDPDTVLYIVKRDDLKAGQEQVLAVRATIPRETVHLTADYENPQGKLVLYNAHNTATDASEWLRQGDVRYKDNQPIDEAYYGLIPSATDINFVGRHTLDASTGELLESALLSDAEYTWGVAFFTHNHQTPPGRMKSIFFNSVGVTEQTLTKRIIEMYEDYPHRKIAVDQLPAGKRGALFHFDAESAQIVDGYLFPEGRAGSSPQFVPRANAASDSDGYLVCTVVSDDTAWPNSSGDEFWIFDAGNIAQGPLTRLGNKQLSLGFTLHTAFLPELKPRKSTYGVDIKEDYATILQDQPQLIKDLFDKEIFPHFT